jgi:hypothetical protein
MAMHQLTTKRLQNDSGQASGIYLFCDGMLLFSPMERAAVLKLAKAGLRKGAGGMKQTFEAIADEVARSVVPVPGEGTHGAGSDNTN